VGFQGATRTFGLGLKGVWGCYVWFCASRVVAFSVIGGLVRPRRWWLRRLADKRKDSALVAGIVDIAI